MIRPFHSWGISGDAFTFLGGGLLALDAVLRLRELHRKRTDEEFRRQFPRLNLTDEEWEHAKTRVKRAIGGFILLALGFLCEIIDRFVM